MKKYIFSAFLVMLTIFSASNIVAQDKTSKNNYVVLSTKVGHLMPVIITAESLKADDGQMFGDFQVIIYGKDVGDITDTETMKPIIARAEKVGVQIAVCEMALKKFNVDKSKVPQGIEIVPNAFMHNFQLQNKGYKSISL